MRGLWSSSAARRRPCRARHRERPGAPLAPLRRVDRRPTGRSPAACAGPSACAPGRAPPSTPARPAAPPLRPQRGLPGRRTGGPLRHRRRYRYRHRAPPTLGAPSLARPGGPGRPRHRPRSPRRGGRGGGAGVTMCRNGTPPLMSRVKGRMALSGQIRRAGTARRALYVSGPLDFYDNAAFARAAQGRRPPPRSSPEKGADHDHRDHRDRQPRRQRGHAPAMPPGPALADGGTPGRAGPPTDTPYERAQRRLRIDGVAYGKALDALREERGWSVRQVSVKSGVPLTTVAKLLRGEMQSPDPEVACALVVHLRLRQPRGPARPPGDGAPGGQAGDGGGRRPGRARAADAGAPGRVACCGACGRRRGRRRAGSPDHRGRGASPPSPACSAWRGTGAWPCWWAPWCWWGPRRWASRRVSG